jgi:thiol-disulfide isomerase/thioredoxin
VLLLLGALLLAGTWPDPWAAKGSGDVAIVSTGQAIELQDVLVQDKFTVIDVGASWCSPCHDAARALRGYAEQHPDTAIRVVNLEGEPHQSMSLPAATLAERGVLPWILVYAPNGERLYGGPKSDKALKKLDRARRKL